MAPIRSTLSAQAARLIALSVVVLAFGVLNYAWSGASSPPPAPAGANVSLSTDPNIARTDASARREGDLSYQERPADVQAVMQRMYANDSRYRTLSALFIDHSPPDLPGSIRIQIQRPDSVQTDTYDNIAGTGAPVEASSVHGSQTTLYAPGANAYTTMYRPLSDSLPSLATLPLTSNEPEWNGTTIYGSTGREQLANMLIQPSSLITSTFFTDKAVTVVGETTFAGRSVWALRGQQIAGTTPLPSLGDAWRMWVDKTTGVVLRLEYYSGSDLTGWLELRDVVIDGEGSIGVSAPVLPALTVPASARWFESSRYSAIHK